MYCSVGQNLLKRFIFTHCLNCLMRSTQNMSSPELTYTIQVAENEPASERERERYRRTDIHTVQTRSSDKNSTNLR